MVDSQVTSDFILDLDKNLTNEKEDKRNLLGMFPNVPPVNPVLKLLPPAVTPATRTARIQDHLLVQIRGIIMDTAVAHGIVIQRMAIVHKGIASWLLQHNVILTYMFLHVKMEQVLD